MAIGALVIGLFVAWRVLRRGAPAWISWFLAVMAVSLGIWIITVFRLLDGSVRLGCLVSILALHVPVLLASTWAIRMQRR